MSTELKCPFNHAKSTGAPVVAGMGPTNRDWWPNQLNLKMLSQQSEKTDPMGQNFD
jgi:catalase-peroxidase